MAPATGATENEAFLITCITNVKEGSGNIKPDWDKIGAMLDMKPHTAYCRWNKIMKTVNISNGGAASGSADAINATFGRSSGGTPKGKATPKATPKKPAARKRKQTNPEVENDEEDAASPIPKAKKSKTGKKGEVKEDEGEEQYVTAQSGGKEQSGEGYDEGFMGI